MARLDARPYAEVGVPMFLVAEDLRGGGARGGGAAAFAAELACMAEALGEGAAALPQASVARAVEVLADRRILGEHGPVFTHIPAETAT